MPVGWKYSLLQVSPVLPNNFAGVCLLKPIRVLMNEPTHCPNAGGTSPLMPFFRGQKTGAQDLRRIRKAMAFESQAIM